MGHIHWRSYFGAVQIIHPALLLEAFPHNTGVTSLVCLLPSYHVLKDTTVGLFLSKLFATCWGMLLQVFRLAYLYFGWVYGLYLVP